MWDVTAAPYALLADDVRDLGLAVDCYRAVATELLGDGSAASPNSEAISS